MGRCPWPSYSINPVLIIPPQACPKVCPHVILDTLKLTVNINHQSPQTCQIFPEQAKLPELKTLHILPVFQRQRFQLWPLSGTWLRQEITHSQVHCDQQRDQGLQSDVPILAFLWGATRCSVYFINSKLAMWHLPWCTHSIGCNLLFYIISP